LCHAVALYFNCRYNLKKAPTMSDYRCYFLGDDDHIKAAEDIDADELGAAIDRARVMLKERPHHRAIELWDGTKRVYPASDR
jgi:hypothetical protein